MRRRNLFWLLNSMYCRLYSTGWRPLTKFRFYVFVRHDWSMFYLYLIFCFSYQVHFLCTWYFPFLWFNEILTYQKKQKRSSNQTIYSYMEYNFVNSTFDEDAEFPPIEYGVSSSKSWIPIGDGDLNSTCFAEGEAHGGRARMYSLAISTGEPTWSSVTCISKTQFWELRWN